MRGLRLRSCYGKGPGREEVDREEKNSVDMNCGKLNRDMH